MSLGTWHFFFVPCRQRLSLEAYLPRPSVLASNRPVLAIVLSKPLLMCGILQCYASTRQAVNYSGNFSAFCSHVTHIRLGPCMQSLDTESARPDGRASALIGRLQRCLSGIPCRHAFDVGPHSTS